MKTQKEEVVQDDKEKTVELRVAGGSTNSSVAGAIIKYWEKDYDVYLVAMGAAAVSQMVKACIAARGILAQKGIDLSIVPSWKSVEVNDVVKSAVRFYARCKSMK